MAESETFDRGPLVRGDVIVECELDARWAGGHICATIAATPAPLPDRATR